MRRSRIRVLLEEHLISSGGIRILAQFLQRSRHAHRSAAPTSDAEARQQQQQGNHSDDTRATQRSILLRSQLGDERSQDQSADQSSDVCRIVDAREHPPKTEIEDGKHN